MEKSTWRKALEHQAQLLTEQALQGAKMRILRVLLVNLTKRYHQVASDAALLAWVAFVVRMLTPPSERAKEPERTTEQAGFHDG